MNFFKKLRFPKISLALFIIGALIMIAIPVRVMLGAAVNLPAGDADFPKILLPILIIGLTSLLLTLVLWLPLRKKGIRFIDLNYPLGTLAAIGIVIFFHIALFA